MGQSSRHGLAPPDRRESPACRGSIPGGEGGEGIVTQEIDNTETRCIITTQAVTGRMEIA